MTVYAYSSPVSTARINVTLDMLNHVVLTNSSGGHRLYIHGNRESERNDGSDESANLALDKTGDLNWFTESVTVGMPHEPPSGGYERRQYPSRGYISNFGILNRNISADHHLGFERKLLTIVCFCLSKQAPLKRVARWHLRFLVQLIRAVLSAPSCKLDI